MNLGNCDSNECRAKRVAAELNQTKAANAVLRAALEETQTLLVAAQHEQRPAAEFEAQQLSNRKVLSVIDLGADYVLRTSIPCDDCGKACGIFLCTGCYEKAKTKAVDSVTQQLQAAQKALAHLDCEYGCGCGLDHHCTDADPCTRRAQRIHLDRVVKLVANNAWEKGYRAGSSSWGSKNMDLDLVIAEQGNLR